MDPIVINILVWLAIVIGLIGTVVPGLPGVGFIYAGILGHALYFGVAEIGISTLVILGIATLFSFVFDIASAAYGAKYFGSSRAGIMGSIIGGIIGLVLFNIFGLILGVFFGAVAGEMMVGKKSMDQSLRAGWGSMVGFLGGAVLKLLLGLIMIGVFVVKVWV